MQSGYDSSTCGAVSESLNDLTSTVNVPYGSVGLDDFFTLLIEILNFSLATAPSEIHSKWNSSNSVFP